MFTVETVPIEALVANPRNARTHSRKQRRQLAASIGKFGFTVPIIIDENNMVLAGHGRLEGARLAGLTEVPCIRVSGWDHAQKVAYAIADNKLALNAGWDQEILLDELNGLIEIGVDVEVTGFDAVEIDALQQEVLPEDAGDPREDRIPAVQVGPAITRAGDVWICGDHRLVCGDARDEVSYRALMQGEQAVMVFTDPPYNVRIDGNAVGSGRIRHREFAMASGEMSRQEFVAFLRTVLALLAFFARDGSIHFVCMDWRHMQEMMEAGLAVYDELKNLIVWVKDNGGMGTFYRSRHELIFAFKKGTAPHINTFELGQNGRYRTNVWHHRGISSGGAKCLEELALHPTVKPVALVADAILDCSRRGDIVLDGFAGSGTILIAAEKTRRRARAIEIDPLYCDTAIRRWQTYAKDDAILEATGEKFAEVERRRAVEGDALADAQTVEG